MKGKESGRAKSLTENAYLMLSQYIVKGKLRPGEQFLAKDLSKSLGMGRTPVREALLRLQNEGVILCNSRHSYNVRVLTVRDVEEIYEILGTLEGRVAGSVCKNITPKDCERLREYNRMMWEAAEKGDLATFGRWNREFHGIFLARFGNHMLHDLCDSIRRQLYAYPVQGGTVTEWMEKAVGEHQEIIRLAQNRDSRKMETYFREVHWSFPRSRKYIEDAFHPDGQFPIPA